MASLISLGGTLGLAAAERAPEGGSFAWTTVTPLTTARSRTAVVFFEPNGLFYTLGGEASGGNRAIPIEEYDPVGDTWTDRALLLTGVSNTGAAVVGSLIYVPGGYSGVGESALQIFDPVANDVELGPPLPAVNYAHAVTAFGQYVHVLGGSSTGVAGTSHYIFDTVGGTWDTGAALPIAVQYPTAVTDGTYIYVIGGNTTNLADVQLYDPALDNWTAAPSLLAGRGGPGSFFDGRQLWAVGGGWATYLPSVEFFDGAAWANGPSLNTGARTLGVAFGNHLAVKAGGWNGAYSAVAEVLDFVIFVDGFESGDMSAWSLVVP